MNMDVQVSSAGKKIRMTSCGIGKPDRLGDVSRPVIGGRRPSKDMNSREQREFEAIMGRPPKPQVYVHSHGKLEADLNSSKQDLWSMCSKSKPEGIF